MTTLKELKKELIEINKKIREGKNGYHESAQLYDLAQTLQTEIALKSNLKTRGYKSKVLNKIIHKYDSLSPKITYYDDIKYRGNNIFAYRFDKNTYDTHTRKGFTKTKVQEISDDISKMMSEKGINGDMMTTVLHPLYDWRSGYFKDVGDRVSLYDPSLYYDLNPDDPKMKYNSFIIYTIIKPPAVGGNDNLHNDCLYNCLKFYIFDIEKYFGGPDKFKKYLGLKRDDKVPSYCIPQIEKKLSTYQINLRGDKIYTSQIKSQKVINLLLLNQHYSVDKECLRKPIRNNTRFKEKRPMLYDKSTYECYDGVLKRILSKEEKNDILYTFENEYILIDREKQKKDKPKITIEEEYEKLIKDIELLKKESNGLVNMYKTGNVNNTALDLFDKMSKFLNEPENILQDEAKFIHEASTASLIWSEKYTGEIHKSDIISLYPYLMISKTKFPIKRGEFKRLETLDDIKFFQYGIYRVEIEESEDKHINKLFRFCRDNKYTHISLEHARKLNLKMNLILDDKPNFLHYSPDKLISFEEVFKPYVMFLFNLKDKGVNKAKSILNRLWGLFGEYDRQKYYSDRTLNISDDEIITEMRPCKNNEKTTLIKTSKISRPYKTNYARLVPFLKSKDRSFMCDIMYPYKEHIHQILTDGFCCDILIPHDKEQKIGCLKYEGYVKNAVINNCHSKIEVKPTL